MKKNNRDYFLKIRINEEEKKLIDNKFISSGFKSKSQFIRTMILEGVVIKADGTFQNISRNIAGIAANINQMAVRCNSTGNVYADDVSEMRKSINDLFRDQLQLRCEIKKLTE